MAVVHGKLAAVYLTTTAASTTTTGESMTRVGSTLWYKAPTLKRVWDKDATVTIYDGGVAITTVQEYDYANGRVRLYSTPAGAVTADFSYFATSQIGGMVGWTLDVNMQMEESACIGDVAKKPYPTIISWKLTGRKHMWDTRASFTTACAGDHNDLVYTAKMPGTAGNLVSVEYLAGVSQTLAVSVDSKAITVQLGTNGAGVVTSTASQVLAAVQNSADAMRLLDSVALAAANDGTGTPAVLTHTHLQNGVDSDYLTRMIAAADLAVIAYTDSGNDYRFAGVGHLTSLSSTMSFDKLGDEPITIEGYGGVYYAEA
jgi:hypothetical protein